MEILALDLASRNTGYCIGNENGEMIKYGSLHTDTKEVLQRISDMTNLVIDIIKKNPNIKKIILEKPFPDYSHTYEILTWLQGIVVMEIYNLNKDIQIEFFLASEWRKILHIKQGRDERREILKKRDVEYVKQNFNIETQDDDISDAICIYQAYMQKNSFISWE